MMTALVEVVRNTKNVADLKNLSHYFLKLLRKENQEPSHRRTTRAFKQTCY